MSGVMTFTMENAATYAEKMLQLRTKGWGDEARSLEDVSRECGMSPRSLKRLIKRETKDIGIAAFGKIHVAYLSFCKRLISQLEHTIAVESERYGDAAFQDFITKVEGLAEEVDAGIRKVKGNSKRKKGH